MRYPLVAGWLRLLRRRWIAGAALFLLVAVTGSALVLASRAVYRAEARLRLGEPPPMSGVSPTAGFFGLLRMGGDPFANDLELLASRTLAEQVVDDVALHVTLDAPRGWHRDSLLASLAAGRNTVRAAFTVRWSGDDVTVTAPAHLPVRGRAGAELRFGGVRAVFRPWREGMPREVVLRTVPHGQAARELGGRMTVERTRRDANVVRVRYQSTDPRVTEQVVSATVARFVALRTQLMQRESGETVDSLRSVALRTRQELAQAEVALETLQRTSGLIAPEAQVAAGIERYSEALGRLEAGRIELHALEQALTRSLSQTDATQAWATLLAYPRFLANATVGELMAGLTELEQKRRELARRRTDDNLELRAVLDQIDHLDRSLRTVAQDFGAALHEEVGALERQVALLRGELAAVPANAIEFGRRQRELRVYSEMVIITEQRLRQEELRQALTFANVQVIDPPALRDRPVWPRRKLGPAVALLIASATALLGVLVVDRADRGVRSVEQVRAALGVPVFASVLDGAVPAVSAEDAGALLCRAARAGGGTARLAVLDAPGGRVAVRAVEAIRTHAAADATAPVCAEALAPAASYGAAAAAAARQVPLFMAVELGVTTDVALARGAALLRQAGAELDGAVIVCRSTAQAAEAWT